MSRLSLILLAPALTLLLTACDGTGANGGSSYENWAQTVSTIPLTPSSDGASGPARELPLAAADKPDNDRRLRVELLTPHQLWDARNGPLNVPSMQVVENLAPPETLPPAQGRTTQPAISQPHNSPTKLIQLGAYSSEQAARQAWQGLKGSAGSSLDSLQPQYQAVEVSGRQLVRLRVAASDVQAQSLCQALASNDPWCQRPSS